MQTTGKFGLLPVALFIALFIQPAIYVRAWDLPIQGPLDKPDGLCAMFVLSQAPSYTCEEYVVQTKDGFLLGVQRMYENDQGNPTAKAPVFLYHGILAGGDSWLLNPPSNSLPFMLGDAGLDVWIGNSRTTNFSSGHVSLSRKDKAFWNWSMDELASYDLPAMLELVSSKTTSRVHYVGYSQGSQSALASFSSEGILPLLDKVALLAPAAYVSKVETILVVAANLFLPDEALSLFHLYEFDPHQSAGSEFLDRICASPEANCTTDVVGTFIGPNCCINESRRAYFDKYGVSTSMKNIIHLSQQIRAHTFAKYDYGVWKNLQVYRSFFPPSYDVTAIPAMPLLLVHGGSDGLADLQDVAVLLAKLQFTPEVILLPDYGHMDFMVGTKASEDVYSRVLDFLLQ